MKNLSKVLSLVVVFILISFTPVNEKIVVIDASHGGEDHGIALDDLMEKDITLAVANKIKELSEGSNLRVILTRDSDRIIYLQDRVELVNSYKPDYLISLHVNSAKSTSESGFELFISNDSIQNKASYNFADRISESLVSVIPKGDINTENFTLLKNSECPAVVLELGYLTNPSDQEYLTNEKSQTKIAMAILSALQ